MAATVSAGEKRNHSIYAASSTNWGGIFKLKNRFSSRHAA
jgi:hypothetical protein